MSNARHAGIEKLLSVMAALRHPQTGCPWDKEQTHASLRAYVIEEAYEVADAIDQNDHEELKKELGDLLLQVVFHGRIAEEEGRFGFNEIADGVAEKMINRHPHIFGDDGERTIEEQRDEWEATKAKERGKEAGVLDGVARALPALTRAVKLQKRAARVGFDWNDPAPIRNKINEELDELANANDDQKLAEFGDVLFAVVNYGRHLGLDPEAALEATNAKFTDRFSFIEAELAKKKRAPHDATLAEMETLWQQAKLNL